MSSYEWINKMLFIHVMAYYSTIKGTSTFYNMDEPGKHAKWKKPDTLGHMLSDSICRKCPEEANP